MRARITYDGHGTPGVSSEDVPGAYWGLGWVHARHRPLQALLVATAARGQLAARLVPRAEVVMLDALVHRLDLPARGAREAERLDSDTASWVDAFCDGFAAGLRARGQPWELRLLFARLAPVDRQAIVAGLMLSAYLGLAEGQEHMERALADCLHAGGDAALLSTMFAPHLEGWDPASLRAVDPRVGRGFAGHALRAAGGSNAWAVGAERTVSGKPLLCGDPHLQINQLPGLFFEVRVRLGDDFWLGASIPGLPGVAVGRNRQVAWTGTFACADNVDMSIEPASPQPGDRVRQIELGRRGRRALPLRFIDRGDGVLQGDGAGAQSTLAVRWAALEGAAQALRAYMRLPLCQSARDAADTLDEAHTLSLHWVLADRGGEVLYKQAGRIPRRTAGWSGLYPVPAGGERAWDGVLMGADLPRAGPDDGCIVSANEAREGPQGAVLATLAQPPYRKGRIEALLREQRRHDVASMQRLQQDVLSLQGLLLRPWLLAVLPRGPVKEALQAWDGRCSPESAGAHAFFIAYRAARAGLAPSLGQAWWRHMLARTELHVWWCRGIDRLLQTRATWEGPLAAPLHEALAACAHTVVQPWGETRRVTFKHLIFGDLPLRALNRGPVPLSGSLGTVSQGNLVATAAGHVAVGPAYRMVCDLSSDCIETSLPGGIDGSAWSDTYAKWLEDHLAGRYHRLEAPRDGEPAIDHSL